MIKRPGTFSKNYMSNPANPRLSRDRNKENKNINDTFDDCDLDFTIAVSQSNTPIRKSTDKSSKATHERQKSEWDKKEWELRDQVGKLKKQNGRLREQLRQKEQELERTNVANQDNICHYETYIKEMETNIESLKKNSAAYGEDLRYCILWLIEIFSKVSKASQSSKPIDLSPNKFSHLFSRLAPRVEELHIQQELEKITISSQDYNNNSYLIYEQQQINQQQNETFNNHQQANGAFEDAQSFMDTFDQRKDGSPVQFSQIAKRLFDRSGSSKRKQPVSELPHSTVAVRNYKTENEDHLELEMGQEIRLLRKVGELWIAESGSKIGYVQEIAFNP